MAASDLTSVAYIVKRLYTDNKTSDTALRDHPTMMAVPKQAGFVGSAYFYPMKYGNPQGISATFSTAQTNAASSKGLQFQASRKGKFGVITINGEALMAAAGNKGSFLDLITLESDSVLEEMGDHLAFELFRDGTGIRGKRSSAATNVITLVTADDARNFKVGMVVGATANSDGSSPRTGTTAVTAVNLAAGTVTLTSAAAIASFADNDFLFASGDQALCVEGFEKCTPLTAPVLASDSFRGVDRGVAPELLAGVRLDDTATSIEENLGLLAVKMSQNGKKATDGVLNPVKFWEVARRLQAAVMYSGAGGSADYGFQYINISTPAGVIKLTSDPDCPTNRGRIWNKDAHYIKHLGGLPHIIKDDSNSWLRSTSADDIEMRVRAFWNYIQGDTAAHGVMSI